MRTQTADLRQKNGQGNEQDDLAHHDQNAGFRRFPQGLHQGNDHQDKAQQNICAEQNTEVRHALTDDSGVLDKPGENRFRRKLDRDIEDQTENGNAYHKGPGNLLHTVILLCAVVRSGGWLEALTGSPQRNHREGLDAQRCSQNDLPSVAAVPGRNMIEGRLLYHCHNLHEHSGEAHSQNFRNQGAFQPDPVNTDNLAFCQEIPQRNCGGYDLRDYGGIGRPLNSLTLGTHCCDHDGVKDDVQNRSGSGDQHSLFQDALPAHDHVCGLREVDEQRTGEDDGRGNEGREDHIEDEV